MENIISTGKWLQIMAAQVDEKGFPKGCGQKLRNIAELFETHNSQVQSLEGELNRVSYDLINLEKHAAKMLADFREAWYRYVSMCELLEKYDPPAAYTFRQYRPFFLETLRTDERRPE